MANTKVPIELSSTPGIVDNSNATAITIDSSENVGIGTSSPTGLLHLSSSAPALYMTDTTNNTESVISMDNAGSLIFNADLNNEAGSSNIRFNVDGAEAMRIASGNLGLGVVPSAWAGTSHGSMDIGVTGAVNADLQVGVNLSQNMYWTGAAWTNKSASYATSYYNQSNDGHEWYYNAAAALGTFTPTKLMKLDALGNLLVGTTSALMTSGVGIKLNASSGTTNQQGIVTDNATSGTLVIGQYNINATFNGWRYYTLNNGGIANFQANDINLSDEREKNQFGPLESTTACLREWEVVKYLYKDEDQTSPPKYGVIAQQVETHCPEVISNWIKVLGVDEVLWTDEDELPEGVLVGDVKTEAVEQVDRIGVKEQQMFWMLVKSHQEALDTIDALTIRLEALEGA